MIDWILGDRFQPLANFTYAPVNKALHDYASYPNTLNLDLLRDGDIIYTQGFHDYKKELLRIIDGSKRVVLVSHNCDEGIDDSYVLPDNVIRWYAQNVNVVNPRIEALPTGMQNDRHFPELRKKEKIEKKLEEKKNLRNLVYIDHRIWTHPDARLKPYELLSGKPWATLKSDADNVPFDEYMDNVYNHKFVISPRGNGMQTHRPWEALHLGCIPIEIMSINNSFFTELPICFVNDWEEVTEDFLNSEYERIRNRTWKMEMLTFEYWKNRIKESAKKIL